APVSSEADTDKTRPNEPESTVVVTACTSLVVLAVAAALTQRSPKTGSSHVSRKSPNSRRRKRTVKGPGGIQAGDRREVCAEILHHQPGRGCCSSISLRRMGADRAEAGGAINVQSNEEEVSDPHELLRAGGGDGRAGAPPDTADFARVGADTRGGGGTGKLDLPGSAEHGSAPERD